MQTAPIRKPPIIAGLASGYDWNQTVEVMENSMRRLDVEPLKSEIKLNENRINTLNDLKQNIVTLASKAKLLTETSTYQSKTITLGNDKESHVLSATATSSASQGVFEFTIEALATPTKRMGISNVGAEIGDAHKTIAALNMAIPVKIEAAAVQGTFSVNGVEIAFQTTETLEAVLNRINEKTNGDVTAVYDSVHDIIELDCTSGPLLILGAASDNSNFLSAFKLVADGGKKVASSSKLGSLNLNHLLKDATLLNPIVNIDDEGNGTFKINNQTISFNINQDTLCDLMARIDGSSAKVKINYDANVDQFTLTNQSAGNLGLSVSESGNGLLRSFGLSDEIGATLDVGANAKFKVNGDNQSRHAMTNKLDVSNHGILGLVVTAKKVGTETITVEADYSSLTSKLRDDFLASFNKVLHFIKVQTRATMENGVRRAALLADNRDVRDIASTLRGIINKADPSNLNAKLLIQRLDAIGIGSPQGVETLELYSVSKFEEALVVDPSNVEQTLKEFANRVLGYANNLTQAKFSDVTKINPFFDVSTNTLEQKNKHILSTITLRERRIEGEISTMKKKYAQYEAAMGNQNHQSTFLQQLGK